MNLIPLADIIQQIFGLGKSYDFITYDFDVDTQSMIVPAAKFASDDAGYFTISMGQSVITSSMTWDAASLLGQIGVVGA